MPGVWGSPQDAFGYPNAMLAKPVTGWENTTAESEPVVLIRFLDFGKTIEGGADDIPLFGHADFSGHGIADLFAADHQHIQLDSQPSGEDDCWLSSWIAKDSLSSFFCF